MNEETRTIHGWLDNDEGYYNAVIELAKNANSERALADSLREWVRKALMPDLSDFPVAQDLMRDALARVDWMDLARDAFVGECCECDEEEEE